MSNKPKFKGKSPQIHQPPKTITNLETPLKLRFYHHVGDMTGCGTIRVIQPSMILNNYYGKDHKFEAIYNNQFLPYQDAYSDDSIVTFQRSAGKQQLEMIKHFKKMNPTKKVIYEIDDDLFNIPEWNFASKFYNSNVESIRSILRLVDGITCSTEYLKQSLLRYNKNINVSPNHLPRFIWGDYEFNHIDSGKPRIMYAGSHNHFDRNGSDKGDFNPELVKFVSKTTDKYQWIFVGGIPESLKNNEKIIHHEWQPVIEYPRFLKSLKPDIFLAPLEDNEFNKSKSNIKALESVALGCPLVATDLEPYKDVPYSCYDTEMMIGQIEDLANDVNIRYQVWHEQQLSIEGQLWWESNNYKNLFHYVNQHLNLFGKRI